MTNEVSKPGDSVVDTAPLDEAFLDIPDEDNPAIIDGRETFRITIISAVLFIAAIYIFVL